MQLTSARVREGGSRRLRRTALALAATIAAVPVAASVTSDAVAADRGANGVIVFEQGAGNMVVLHANGSETVLTPSNVSQGSPAVSPDGGRIAFNQNYHLWVEKIDGTGAKAVNVTGNPYENDPVWSPNATKIAYINGSNGQIYTVPAGGGNPVQLTTNGGHINDIKWSPDGTKIVYDAFDSGTSNTQIFTVGVTGKHPVTRLTSGNCTTNEPDWSPDGTQLAVSTSCFDGNGNIGVMSASGGAMTPVAEYIIAGAGYPSWSPDGTTIVFSANEGMGSSQLWESSPNNPGDDKHVSATVLTHDPGQPYDTMPSWQPVHHPTMTVPASGKRGSQITVSVTDFLSEQTLPVSFKDAAGVKTVLAKPVTPLNGSVSVTVTVPASAALGTATITVSAGGLHVSKKFTVTS